MCRLLSQFSLSFNGLHLAFNASPQDLRQYVIARCKPATHFDELLRLFETTQGIESISKQGRDRRAKALLVQVASSLYNLKGNLVSATKTQRLLDQLN